MNTSPMVREDVELADGKVYSVATAPKEGVKGFTVTDCEAIDNGDGKYDLTAMLSGRQNDNADNKIPEDCLKVIDPDTGKTAKTFYSRGTLFDKQAIILKRVDLSSLIMAKLKNGLYGIDAAGWEKYIKSDQEICNLELYKTVGEGRASVAQEYKDLLAKYAKMAKGAGHPGTMADGTKLTHGLFRSIELDEAHPKHAGVVAWLAERREKLELLNAESETDALDIS